MSFGVGYLSDIPVAQFTITAQAAEEVGIGSFWIAESHYHRGVFALAANLACQTSKIGLGVGVVSPFTRHPAATAMEAATVHEISGGRFILGLGTSRRMMLGLGLSASPLIKEGLPHVSAIKAMVESVEIIRRLFAGETVTYQGQVFRLRSPGAEAPGVRLGVNLGEKKIPIYIGATGPKMLKLSGRIADGVLLTLLTTPAFVRFANSLVRKGLEESGRLASDMTLASYLLFSVGQDRQAALDSVRTLLTLYITRVEPIVLEKAGLSPDDIKRIENIVRERGLSAAAKLLDDETVKRFAVAGTPDDCVERLGEYFDAGLQVPIAMQIIGPEVKTAIKLIASDVIPNLPQTDKD